MTVIAEETRGVSAGNAGRYYFGVECLEVMLVKRMNSLLLMDCLIYESLEAPG